MPHDESEPLGSKHLPSHMRWLQNSGMMVSLANEVIFSHDVAWSTLRRWTVVPRLLGNVTSRQRLDMAPLVIIVCHSHRIPSVLCKSQNVVKSCAPTLLWTSANSLKTDSKDALPSNLMAMASNLLAMASSVDSLLNILRLMLKSPHFGGSDPLQPAAAWLRSTLHLQTSQPKRKQMLHATTFLQKC